MTVVSVRIGLRPDRWHIATLAGCGAQLSRLWSERRLCAGVGVMYGGWTSAQPLEVHGPRFSNACTDLQRLYPTLTSVVGRATPAPARLRHWSSHVCGRHAASAPQALELCTEVGQAHWRWRCTARGSPTRVPISNVCTQVSRLWSGARLPPRPGSGIGALTSVAGTPPLRRRWS